MGANPFGSTTRSSKLRDEEAMTFDPTVVRGLAYYTGPVFEAELTYEIRDENGRKSAFGSIAGGGRYDDLVQRFTGKTVPATGLSIGVDRLLAAIGAMEIRGGVGVKDMKLGAQLSTTVSDREQWRVGQPAQKTVERSMLIEAVRSAVHRDGN